MHSEIHGSQNATIRLADTALQIRLGHSIIIQTLISFLAVGLYAGEVQAEDNWRSERYRLTVPNPEPKDSRANLRLIELSKTPQKPSQTATELLKPLLRVAENIQYSHRATIRVNAAKLNMFSLAAFTLMVAR